VVMATADTDTAMAMVNTAIVNLAMANPAMVNTATLASPGSRNCNGGYNVRVITMDPLTGC